MPEGDTPANWQGGEVLFAGGTDWETIGKTTNKKKAHPDGNSPDLLEPHRLKSLLDVKIRFVAAGASASHCMAVDMNGLCYTWGRNEKGQLGHDDFENRSQPTVLEGLSEHEIISGACGKNHTAFVTENGLCYTCGSNAMGQCGIGELKWKDKLDIPTPVQAVVTDCRSVTCGAEFTVWLCDGKLYAAGSPQYGVLGDGSSHEYNMSASGEFMKAEVAVLEIWWLTGSVKMAFEPVPTPKLIKTLENREIVRVVAGNAHVMTVDVDGIPYTWGNGPPSLWSPSSLAVSSGNYGRLGHSVQQDEWKPRPIESFLGRVRVNPKDIIVTALPICRTGVRSGYLDGCRRHDNILHDCWWDAVLMGKQETH